MIEQNIETENGEIEEQVDDSGELESKEENKDKKVKKIKLKKLNKKKDNKFPREDRNEAITKQGINPRQFSEAWTTCSRCRKQILSYADNTHFINGYQYCEECYDYVKKDFLEQEPVSE